MTIKNGNTVHLKGLDPNKMYKDTDTGKVYSGALLMHRGKRVQYAEGDFATEVFEFVEV